MFSPERLALSCKRTALIIDRIDRALTACSGDDVRKLFKYCQEKQFAIPAINVTSSSTVVASLEAARDAKSPIILQISQGGAVSLII